MSHQASSSAWASESLKQRPFAVDMFLLPKKLDPSNVETAYHHVVLRHLTRSLIGFSTGGELVGDLAESWQANDANTEFTFTLKPGLKWSNGEFITVDDVIETIKRHQRLKDSVHFNFTSLKSISRLDEQRVRFELSESNTQFILEAKHPEFGVLHKSDRDMPAGNLNFKITSGPFSVVERTESRITLIRNPYYEKSLTGSPEKVVIQSLQAEELSTQIGEGKIDLVYESDFGKTDSGFNKITQAGMKTFVPHVGFTYWVGINPNSKVFSKLENRRYLQKLLTPRQFDFSGLSPFWSKAIQIYMPDGAGRPKKEALERFWTETESLSKPAGFPKELTLLTRNLAPFMPQIDQALKKAGIKVNKVIPRSVDEFKELKGKGNFDLDVYNNDMAGSDVLGSLLVCFNRKQPYIVLNEGSEIPKWLAEAKSASNRLARYKIYEAIGMDVLKSALIVPVAYSHRIFYFAPEYDTSNLSTLFSDISFHKITAKRKSK